MVNVKLGTVKFCLHKHKGDVYFILTSMKLQKTNSGDVLYDASCGAIFVLLVAGTGLFITRFTFDSFILPKNVWIEVWVWALLFIYGVRLLFGRPFRLMFSPITGVLAAYVFINLLSGFVAGSRSLWWDEVRRLLVLFIFALLFQDYVYGNRRRLFVLIWALSISVAITATWTIWEDFAGRFFPQVLNVRPRLSDWRGFISAGFGNTGHIADYVAILFPMNILLYLHVRGKLREVFLLYTIAVSYAAMIVCWSVQSNVGVIIATVVLIYFFIKYKPRRFWRRRRLRIVAALFVIILITIFYITPLPVNPHKPSIIEQAFSSERWHFGGESRLVIWAQTLEIIRHHPWLGCGVGNFSYQYVQQCSPFLLSRPRLQRFIGSYTNAAHNEILQSWSETGVFGPAILFILVLLVARALVKPIEETSPANRWVRVGALCALAASFFPAMMSFPLRLPTTFLLFFALCSVPIVLVPKTKYFSDYVRIPVELKWKDARITVFLENFSKPVGGSLHFELRRRFTWGMTALLTICFIVAAFNSIRPIVSDAYFKEGKSHIETFYQGYASASMADSGEKELRRALVWWHNNHDCRSTLGQYLFHRGRFKEAIYQLRITLKRLQAAEIYYYAGASLEAIGEKIQATRFYKTFFEHNPTMKTTNPELYHHTLMLMKASRKN